MADGSYSMYMGRPVGELREGTPESLSMEYSNG